MATQSPTRAPKPRQEPALSKRYESIPRHREHTPISHPSEAEPRLGPYETRYMVQLGYIAPVRTTS